MAQFSGFSKDFFKFFEELKKNNNRPWFNANKSRYYESVVSPISEFIVGIGPGLKKISSCYKADPKPHGGSMFRIYRDTRFSKDQTPYKTHAACHFRHTAGRDAHAPGFYVHIETDRITFGGGIWLPPSKQLGQIRDFIIDNPSAWEQMLSSTVVKRAGGIRGDALKRPPRGYPADARHIDDLKKKSFYLMSEADASLALESRFVTETLKAFRAAANLNHLITDALELPF